MLRRKAVRRVAERKVTQQSKQKNINVIMMQKKTREKTEKVQTQNQNTNKTKRETNEQMRKKIDRNSQVKERRANNKQTNMTKDTDIEIDTDLLVRRPQPRLANRTWPMRQKRTTKQRSDLLSLVH